MSRDIEKNPGPRPSSSEIFLDLSLEPKQFTCAFLCKKFSLKTYLSIHKLDKASLRKTYLDLNVPLHDVNLETQGYKLFQSDHLSQHKRGGVCIFFRNSPPVKILNIHYLQESKSFKLQAGSKICKFVFFLWTSESNN